MNDKTKCPYCEHLMAAHAFAESDYFGVHHVICADCTVENHGQVSACFICISEVVEMAKSEMVVYKPDL